MNTRPHRLLFHRHIVVLHLDDPNIQPVVEAVEIHIRPAVIIDEQRIVDTLLVSDHRLLLLLHERPQRRVGDSNANVLLGGEIHVKPPIQPVDLGSPEPFLAPDIRAMQCQPFAGAALRPFPRYQVPGSPHLDAVHGTRAVGVIYPIVKQDERIGQRHLPRAVRRPRHRTAQDEQRRDQ